MRLLNTTTLCVESVFPGAVPDYAILSHRWLDDEVSFQDISTNAGRRKAGFAKVQACCELALREGLSHVWIDTCCIDKTSSAELSEAINSMFKWYREARVCYAYLYDTTGAGDLLRSDWFNRGWTLQELIAPRHVVFYAGDWSRCGDRSTLSPIISAKTGISAAYLHGQQDLAYASIAERMSWAAARQTTREEDLSYCLLGIFDIQMPLIYGEGAEKAFHRLQRKLIEESSDQSWLAWSAPPGSRSGGGGSSPGSVMASSPAHFKGCRDIVPCNRDSARAPVTVTNVGVHLSLPILARNGGPEYMMLLDCRWRHDYTNVISVPLSLHSGCYFRISDGTTVCPDSDWPDESCLKQITLSTSSHYAPPDLLNDLYYFNSLPAGIEMVEVEPSKAWEPSPAHVRISREGDRYPKRLVRLRFTNNTPEDPTMPTDYVLRLTYLPLRGHPPEHHYQMGILPRGCALSEADIHVRSWGKAILVPALKGAITLRVTTKKVYGRDTHVVDVYIDETDIWLGPPDTWAIQVLPKTPHALSLLHQAAESQRHLGRATYEEGRRSWLRQQREDLEDAQRRQREEDIANRQLLEENTIRRLEEQEHTSDMVFAISLTLLCLVSIIFFGWTFAHCSHTLQCLDNSLGFLLGVMFLIVLLGIDIMICAGIRRQQRQQPQQRQQHQQRRQRRRF